MLVPSLAFDAQAPVGGTITNWSVEDFDGTARLLVLTANEDGTYMVTARSPEQTEPCVISSMCGPAFGVVYTFSSNLTIAAGQYIGVELISPANCKESPDDETCATIGFSDPNAGSPSLSDRYTYLEPTPAEGSPQAPNKTRVEGEILVSAELQTGSPQAGGSSSSGGGGSSSGATSQVTATEVTCNLTVAIASDTCMATVTDTSSSGATAPTGQVSFSSESGGSFNAGDTCTLVAEPPGANTASCSVNFLPPAASSTPTAITADYSGDATHSPSSGKTHYATLTALKEDITISLNATISETGASVEVPASCQFPCSVTGQLNTGPGLDISGGEVPVVLGLHRGAATQASKDRKKPAKSVVLGAGALRLSKPGKGLLLLKLNQKARRAIERATDKAFRGVLEITIRTAGGTVVTVEKKTLTIHPHAKRGAHHKA